MNLLTLSALALAPVLAIIFYFFIKDKYEKEPLNALILSFIYGCLSVIFPLALNYFLWNSFPEMPTNLFNTAIKAFIIIAATEEFGKFLALKHFTKNPNFNEPYDGIFYGAMISLGFAAVENLMYVYSGGWTVAVLRMFTAVPAHAVFGAIMGYYFGLAWMEKENKVKHMASGLIAAIILHGTYDFFLIQENYPGLAFVSILGLFLSFQLVKKAITAHNARSPNKKS